MGVLRKSGADLMELLNLKKNEVVSLEAAETQLDLIARLTGTCFKLEVHNSRPALKDLGHTHEASLKMLQNHNAIISQVHLLKAEWEGCLEGAGNSFELKQLLKNAFTNVEEQLNDKKSQLNLKLQAEEIGNGFLPSLTPLLPSFPVTSSSPRGFYGNQTAPSIVQGCKDKNQKFGLPCCLEVHVMAAPEAEIYWFLNHSLLATITPTTTNNNDKNITTSKQTANNNTNIYKLNIANFGHDYTGLYTLIARNQAGEVSCKCRLDHISNHSTPRSNQSPMTNRSISREDNRSDHNHPLSSIPEDNFQGPPRFLEGLRGTDAWEGDSVLFKVHLLGTPEAEVRWFREGVEIANSPDFRLSRDSRFRNIHLLEIPEIFLEDAGRFTCIATNALGSCQSTATLVVRAPSELASIPGLYSDQSLEDFGLSFTPTSRSTTSSVVNLSSCIINTQALPMGTSEDCIKPYFKAISRDLEVSNGKVARFDSMVAGKPVPDVMWFRDDRRLMTDDKYAVVVNEKGVNSLIINACDLHDSGIYRCIACNSGGQDQFQVKLTVTVGPTRTSPTGSMTFLNNAPPNYSILRNFHSEERGSNRVRGQTRKSDIHSEERSVVRRNFYKTTDVKQTHTSLRDHINGRGSPKKFVFSKLSAVNSTDEASAGPPQLLQPIDDPEVQEGDCALLECRVFSPGKCFYQWFFNNQPLQNDPNKYEITAHNDRYSLKVWDLNANDRGFYQCTVVNQDGEVTCIGRVNPLGSVISRPGSEIKICKSPTPFNLPSYCTRTIQEVKLSCTVIGRPKPKLTWYIGDEIILPTCEDFKSSYDKETGLVELRIRNVEKYLNRKIKCVAENERGVAETECILTDSLLSDPTFTHPDYSNLLIHQISSRHNLPSFNTAPRFSHRVKPKMVAEGDAVTLSAVVHGRPQPIVKWMKDGVTEIIPSKRHVLIFNERSNVCQLKILNCQALDSGTYSCVAYNPNGQTTCSTSLFIAPPGSPSLTFDLGSGIPVTEKFPQFTANLEPTYKATVGQPVKFTCRIKKEPSLHVTWYFNGIEISSGHVMKVVDGDVISSLSIPHPKPANKGEYSCHVRNLHGEATTSTYLEVEESTITTVQYSTREEELKFSMPVLQTHSMALPPNEDINRYYNAPPSFQQPLVNHITTEGSEAFLVVRFMGEPAPSIQWFVNGNLISEKNSNYRITSDFSRKESILYLKEVFAGDDGEYTCKAENISGIAYTTSHLYVKTSSRQGMREESYLSGSSHAEDGKPKFNVALTLARPERHVEVGREFELHDERETRRVQVERKFSVPPEQAFSETISIDKSEQKVVEVDVPKPRKMSEVHIQRPSVTSAISEMDVEMMKSIDLVPQKDPQQFVTTQDCELRKLQIESEYALVPEANFTETVSIDKSEVQEVVFDSPATKKTSEVILNQEASLQGVKMEAEIILLEEPQNFSETVSIDRSRDQEVEFSVQKSQQTSELTVQQQSMPKGSRIEAEILPEEKQTTELLVERGSAPKFLVELVPVNVMDGSPVYFTTKVFASPMPEYVTWYRNEQNCEEVVHIHVDYDIETGVSNLHIAEVFPEDSGRYTCVVSNQFGTAKSTATLTVSAYDTTEMLEYDEVSRISSDEDAAACNLIEGKVVRSDMTKERSVHVQPSHAKLRKTETSTNEFTQPFVQMIENKQIRSSVEAGVALGRNKTNVCSYMAKQIKQDPGKFERVFEIIEKNLRKSPLNWEVVVRNVQGIDGKMVLPTLARLAVTKLNVEETKILVDAIQKVKITHSLEGATPLERNEGVKVPFMSKQIKKDVCKYEVVDENMDCEGAECIENVCGISEDYPNCQLIHKELCKVVKGHNVSTLTKLIHAEEDSVENVDLIREDRNFEKLASKPEPRPVFDMSSKSVVASLAKQISKSPECFEAVDEAFDSSGYESTGRLSNSSDGPMLGTQYVTSCLSHASVKQKVPALTKTLVDRNYNLEVSLPEHKVYLEDKATPGCEPTLAMSKGLGVKTQFRTKQRRKEPLHCDVVDGEVISDLSLHSSDTRYEVTKDRLLSRSVKNVLTTNVLAKRTELTLEETGEDVRGHEQQQPTTSFELQFCSEKNEKSEIHFRSNQLNKGKSVYETVSHKVQSPEQEIVSGLGDQLLNSTRSEVVTKEACKPHVESSLTTRVSSNRCSLVLEQTSDMEERKENKCNSLVEATPTFASRNLVLVPFLARQIPKDKDKFETVCHTKSLAHETTGEFITNFDSFANTSEMTTKLLGKATTSCSVLSLAVLARTTMLHWESVFPFARLLNEDRANLSEQEASLIAALESTTTSFMTKPLTKTLQSYESIDNSLASLSLCSDKLSATETSKSVHFEYSSKTSALFHSPHLTTKATDVDCVDNTFDEKPVVKAEINFEPSFVKRGQSKTRQNIYAAYQYLDSESDAQSDSVSTTAIDMRPSEKAFEQYISKVTVMSEPVKMHEYHITPLLEQFAEERLYGVSSDYSSTQVSATLTENNLVNQSSKVFNKTFTLVVKAKDDFVDTVKTLEIHIKPEEIKHEEVTVDIGMGRKEPATLLHGASQRLQLNLDRVEELKTSFKSTYIPCHDIPSDLEMSDVSQPTPTFIRSSIDHAKHQQIHGINVDLNFNHTFPDLISANFNKYVDKMKLINHSSSIVDIKKAEVVRMMEQPFIKSILSVPEKVGVRLMRLECIDTTLFRTSLLEYLMLLEQQFAFKSIDLDSETTVIPYADIVTVETGMASSEDKAKTRLLTNVYFLQLEEVQDVDYSVSSCKNQETVSASAQFHFSEKSKLINYCLQQFKSTNTENVVLEALSKISAMLCVPENMVCNIERSHVSDATLYRAPLTDYVLLLEKVLSMQAFNIDDLAVILPHSEMVTLQTGLAMLSQKPLLRSQANVFFLKLDDVSENDTSIESFSIQPDVLIKEINCSYKQEKEATFVLPLTSNRQQELTFETISPKLAPTYNAPKEEQSNFKKIHKDDKVLSRVSVSDYILLLEKIMALNTFNIDNAAMNLPTPDLVLLQTFHASQQAQPLTRVQPNLFYLQLEQAEDFSAKVDNEDAQISKTGSEMFQLENKMTFLSHIQATVNHKKQEQISEKMILNTISNVSNTFCIPQNVVCKIDRAHKSDAVLYRAPLVDYVLLLDRMLSLQSMNLDDLSVVLPQAELTLLQTSLAMTSQRPLHRSQHQLYLLKIENAIEKNMSFESSSIKPQHIVREIAKANKQRPYSYSPSRTHNKQPDHVQAANNNVEAKDRRMPDFIKSTFSKSSQKDKVLSRVSVSEYMLLLERLVALDGLSIDDCSVKLPLPDLAILQTVTASCEDKPCSRVQPSLFFMNLEQVATHDSHVEKSTANASQTKVQLDVQSSMSKVKEYFKEPQEVVEEEEKALMNEPIKQKPDDEDFFEDMFETWETKQKTEVTAESEGESDSSTESLYEEWEFTTIKKRVVEEEFPTKRSVIQVERPESQESTMFMERSQNTTSAYSDEKDYSSSTSFDRSVFCTDVFNKVIRKNVDESYTRPSFMTEITTSERVKNHSVTLSSVVSAIPEPEIEWYKDGMKIANSRHFSTYYGDGSCKLTIHKFTPRYSGRYACRAINEVGMNESYINLDYDFFEPDGQEVDKSYDHMTFEESFVEIKEEWMNVVTEDISYKSLQIPTAPAFEQEISSITVVDGGNVTLYCKLLSYPEATIEWYLRNKLIKQSQDFRMGYKDDYCYLNIREAMPHDQGEYTVKAYNEHGFAETIIYLTVLDTYELSETREVKTRSSKTQRFYKETSTKDVDCMEAERKMKSFKAQSAESRAAKKALRAVDSDEEAYSSGEESLEMWTIEEWLFYDYKKYYNADVFVKKRDDYLEYYKYVPYDEKSFLERISSVKAALSDTHAFRFPVIIKELPILEVFEGKRVEMECVVEAKPLPQITWFKNGKRLESSEHVRLTFENNVAKLSIEQALLDDEAEYKCEARNDYGSSFTWGQLYVETVQLRWGRIKNFKIVRKKCLL